jgi:hypothetical protein
MGCGTLLALPLIAALAGAGVPPAAAAAAESKEYALEIAAGRKALGEGKTMEARAHFLMARSIKPEEPEVLGDLIKCDAKDAGARYLWALEAAAATADDKGRVMLPKGFPAIPPEDNAPIRALVQKRWAALQELRKAATAKGADGPTMAAYQRYLRRIADRLSEGSPVLRKEAATAHDAAAAKCPPDRAAVEAGLRALIAKGKAPGNAALGLSAARVLRGILFQASQKAAAVDPKGGASKPADLAELDAEIQGFREQILSGIEKRRTAAQLLAIPESMGPEFQALHGTVANPAIAFSPKERYRIESIAGLQTLQAVVRNVERCHDRLARWNGKDPFDGGTGQPGQQGRIRLCPSYADMESDGAPFWWAGGWQQGRNTTVFACFADALSLSSVLTHELTHRFDGTLYPGLPAWLMEGRAVHTEICTGSLHATSLDESRCDLGRLLQSRNEGIGRAEELTKVLEGTGDYRVNYSAGYAIWVFLTTFRGFESPTPDPIYGTRVADYLASCGSPEGAKDGPLVTFKRAFVDGKDGRAASLKVFGEQLGRFLYEVAAALPHDEPAWVTAWRMAMASRRSSGETPPADGAAEPGPLLYDRSNWPDCRVRSAPPEPGTGQARIAAGLFLAEKMPKERILALEWAAAVDDAAAPLLAEAAAAQEAAGAAGPAWALRRTAEIQFTRRPPEPVEAPPKDLAAMHKAVAAVVEVLDAETDRAATRSLPRLALALRAERDDLAATIALPAKGLTDPLPADPTAVEDTAPHCGAWTSFATANPWGRSWAPLDAKPSSNWHLSGETGIVVGSPRDSTGETITRWYQNAFVECFARLEGTYAVETTVRAESAYFEALLVIGKEGDDRGFTVTVAGGDEAAAIRSLRSGKGVATVWLTMGDGRPLEEKLSRLGRDVSLEGTSPVFRLGVVVSGPSVVVTVNGEPVLRHRRLTGSAVAGTVGFGVRHGTVAFVQPRYRKHRAAGDGRRCACAEWDAPLPWNGGRFFPFRMLQGRRISPEAPSPLGGTVFWYTEANLPAQMAPKAVREVIGAAKDALKPWASDFATLVSFPPAGTCLNGLEFSPPGARELRVAEDFVGSHALQPEFAGRIWKSAAGVYDQEFRKGEMAAERRTFLEDIVGKELDSPFVLWFDPSGVVRRAYPRASPWRLPGMEDALYRYFAGW